MTTRSITTTVALGVAVWASGCRMRIGNDWAPWLLLAVLPVICLMIYSFVARLKKLRAFAPMQGGIGETTHTVGRSGGKEVAWGWEKLASSVSLTRRAVKSVLLVLALVLLIGGLARPQYGGTEKMLKVKGIDMVVALDFSKSMLARDVKPDRISMAKREVEELLDKLTGDRVGVVLFAGSAISYPLTTDYDAISLFLRDITPMDMPLGGTNIGAAIEAGVNLLTSDPASKKRSKVLLIITDGEDHEGLGAEAAHQASKEGIKIFILRVGGDAPELIPEYLEDGTQDGFQRGPDGKYATTVTTTEHKETLEKIAKATGGIYIQSAPGKISLAPVVEEIRKLKQAELKARKVTIYDEFYMWLLLPAILMLVVESLISDSKIGIIRLIISRRYKGRTRPL